jgi:hypothetical protein
VQWAVEFLASVDAVRLSHRLVPPVASNWRFVIVAKDDKLWRVPLNGRCPRDVACQDAGLSREVCSGWRLVHEPQKSATWAEGFHDGR